MRRASSRRTARPSASTTMPARRAARGLKVIIAGAGGAAHLPGMAAALTPLPVLGVPVESRALEGHGQPALDRPDAGRRPGRRPSPSARPARSTPRCFAAAILGARRQRASPQALDGWRADADRRCRPSARAGIAADDASARARTIGILGGGQLGRMTALAAARARLSLPRLLPTSPTARRRRSAPRATVADYGDRAALARFAAAVDVVTFEFENIPAEAVRRVAALQAGAAAARSSARSRRTACGRRISCARSASRPPRYREVAERGGAAPRAARLRPARRAQDACAWAMTARAR